MPFMLCCARCEAQTSIASPPSHGIEIVVLRAAWVNDQFPDVCLAMDFRVLHADGTPVSFVNAANAVQVSGGLSPQYDSATDTWSAAIFGIDPSKNSARLEFEVRDPRATAAQASDLVSSFKLGPIPAPNKMDEREDLDLSYTSAWGTTFALSGLEVASRGSLGRPWTELFVKTDHSSVPDDRILFRITGASDGGKPINDVDAISGSEPAAADGSVPELAGPVATGTDSSLQFEFSTSEHSESKAAAVAVYPLQLDLPLMNIPRPPPGGKIADQSTAAIAGIEFRIDHIQDPAWRSYDIWMRPSDPAQTWELTDISWLAPAAPKDEHECHIGKLLWHVDGSPKRPGEDGWLFNSDPALPTYFPIEVTVCHVKRIRTPLSFTAVRIPQPGQTLTLDQKPDGMPSSHFVLRSISWLPAAIASSTPQMPDYQRIPNTLSLKFSYDGPEIADITAILTAARDNHDDCVDRNKFLPRTADTSQDEPNDANMFDFSANMPADGSHSINLKMLVINRRQIGMPLFVTVDASDHWAQTQTPPPPEPSDDDL